MEEQKYLNQKIKVFITNPIGSIDNGFIYPVNYGYIIDDNIKINVYLLGVYQPIKEYTGNCLAILKSIDEYKLIVVPEGKNYSNEQIEAMIEFQKENLEYLIIRKNDLTYNFFIELAGSLMHSYKEQLEEIRKRIIYVIINNIHDVDLIEHILDSLLDIPIEDSEKLYNFLCSYLEKYNMESAKFYKLEYKNMWH